jgi:UDP-glucose 4-epimerase
MMWEEAVMTYFNDLSQHLSAEIWEKHKNMNNLIQFSLRLKTEISKYAT